MTNLKGYQGQKLPRSKVINVKGQQGHRGQMSPRSKRSKVTEVKTKVKKVTEVKDQVQGQMLWFFKFKVTVKVKGQVERSI